MIVARVIAALACVLLAGKLGIKRACSTLFILRDFSEPDDDNAHNHSNNNDEQGGVHNHGQNNHGCNNYNEYAFLFLALPL